MVQNSQIKIINGRKVRITSPAIERLNRLQVSRQRQEQMAQQTNIQQLRNSQINLIQSNIKSSQERLNNQLSQRDRRFGTSPKLSVRRSRAFKEMTAERRAERQIIQDLSILLSKVKQGGLTQIKGSDIGKFKSEIRSIERSKTKRAIGRLQDKTTKIIIQPTPTTEFSKKAKAIIIKAQDPRLVLTVSDFRTLQKEGVSSSQLLNIQRRSSSQINIIDNAIKSNSQPSFKNLIKSGLNNSQANLIINQWSATKGAERNKDTDTTKFWQAITKPDGSLRKDRFVDNIAQTQAFKITANQFFKNAGFKPLSFDSSAGAFQSRLNTINRFINGLDSKASYPQKLLVAKEIKDILTIDQNQVFIKGRFDLVKRFNKLIGISESLLTKIQKSRIGRISWVRRAINKSRAENQRLRGVTNREDLRLVSKTLDRSISTLNVRISKKGVIKAGNEIIAEITNFIINPRKKQGFNIFTDNIIGEGLKLSYRSGQKLGDRYLAGKLGNDVRRILNGSIKAATYVKNNPAETLVLGGIAGLLGSTAYINALKKSPEKTLINTALILAPSAAVKAVTIPSKLINRGLLSKIWGKSSNRLTKANGQLLGSIPSWDITFDRAKFINQLRKESERLGKKKKPTKTEKAQIKTIEKVSGEVLTTKEAEFIKRRFEKKATIEIQIKKLPKSETNLISNINKFSLLNNKQIQLLAFTIQKISKRFRLTTTQTKNKGLFKITLERVPKKQFTESFLIKGKFRPVDEKSLISRLQEARLVSGEAFSRLKKKIKKDLGLNVVVRETGKTILIQKGNKFIRVAKVDIKLLKPKVPKGKGKKETKRISIEKEKLLKLSKEDRRRLKKQSDQVELLLENGLIDEVVNKVQPTFKKFGKKGSAQFSGAIQRGASKFFKKSNRDGTARKRNTDKLKKDARDVSKNISATNKANKQTKNEIRKLSSDISKLNSKFDTNDRNRAAVINFLNKIKSKQKKAVTKGDIKAARGLNELFKKNSKKLDELNTQAKKLSSETSNKFKRASAMESRLRSRIKSDMAQVQNLKVGQLQKLRNKLKNDVAKLKKQRSSLNKLKSLGFAIKLINNIGNTLGQQIKQIENLLIDIGKIDSGIKLPSLPPPKIRPPKKPPGKPIGKPPSPPPPPRPKIRPPKKPPGKPPKKPKKLKIPKIRIPVKKLKTSRKIVAGYVIKIKKGNQILAVSDKLLPRIRAENTARRIVNGNTGNFPLSSSYEVIRVGKTRVVDEKKLVLETIFRRKRSKRTKVLISVEIRKARLNTPKELKAFKKAKRLKKK